MNIPLKIKAQLKILKDLVGEGVVITREAATDAIMYSADPLQSMLDVERKFKLWRESIKRFVESIDTEFDKGVFYQDDRVPYLRGGFEYGNVKSNKSQKLIKSIQHAAQVKLTHLRKLQDSLKDSGTLQKEPTIKLPYVFFDKNSGIGYVNERKFKLKNNQWDFFIFGLLFKSLNKSLSKTQIAQLGNIQGKDSSRQTYLINEVTKKLRKLTHLNKEYLVLNNGSLTLRAVKMKSAPKYT